MWCRIRKGTIFKCLIFSFSASTDSGTFELSNFGKISNQIRSDASNDDSRASIYSIDSDMSDVQFDATQIEVEQFSDNVIGNRNNGFMNLGMSCYQNSVFHFVNSMTSVQKLVFEAANSRSVSALNYADRLVLETEKIFNHIEYGESPFNASSFMSMLRWILDFNSTYIKKSAKA